VSRWRAGAREPVWETIVSEPAPLAELVTEGNGKDLGLEVALAGGRRLQMGAGDVAVSADGLRASNAAAEWRWLPVRCGHAEPA
jgi:hypothetical protein